MRTGAVLLDGPRFYWNLYLNYYCVSFWMASSLVATKKKSLP